MAKSFQEALAAKKAEDREKTLGMLVSTANNISHIVELLASEMEKIAEKQVVLDLLVERHEKGEDVTPEVAKLYESIKAPKTDHWR